MDANARSWELFAVQREQLARWVHEYPENQTPKPSKLDRTRAWLGMEKNAIMRRAAYTVLRMKGAFDSD